MLKREYGVSNTISTRIGNTMLQEKSLGRAKEGTGTSVNFSGTWINELQSTVTLTQDNDVGGTARSEGPAGYNQFALANDESSSGRRRMGLDQRRIRFF